MKNLLLLSTVWLGAACGGGTDAVFTGMMRLDATNTFQFPTSGGSASGTTSFTSTCTHDGDGSGHTSSSFTLHVVLTDSNGGSTTTDLSGSDSRDLDQVSDECDGSVDTGTGVWALTFKPLPFDVTGTTVSGDVSTPVTDSWTQYDYQGLEDVSLAANGQGSKGDGRLEGESDVTLQDGNNPLDDAANLTWSLQPK